MTPHWPPKLPELLQPLLASDVWREIYHRLLTSRLQTAHPPPQPIRAVSAHPPPLARPHSLPPTTDRPQPCSAPPSSDPPPPPSELPRCAPCRPPREGQSLPPPLPESPSLLRPGLSPGKRYGATRPPVGSRRRTSTSASSCCSLALTRYVGGGGFRVARDRGAEILWSCRPVALRLVFGRAQANNCVSPGQRPQQRKSRLLPTRPKRGPRGFGPWRLFGDLTSMFPETDHRKGALCQRPRSRQPRHRRGRHGD